VHILIINTTNKFHPSIHLWFYSPFRALASLTRRLHSSLFVALLHPLVPRCCSASLWTTFTHLVLGLPTDLVVWKFPFRTYFGILSSSILIIWPAYSSLLILMSSTIFGSLYKLYSSLFHLGRQHPLSCVEPYILHNIFLSNVFSICSDGQINSLNKIEFTTNIDLFLQPGVETWRRIIFIMNCMLLSAFICPYIK
jgi:hypothetical protein